MHYRFISGFLHGKINFLKFIIIIFFSIKHIKISKSYQKEYRDNITDEQEQKRREAIRQYQKKNRDNMSDEQKQKRRETNRRYQKNIEMNKK